MKINNKKLEKFKLTSIGCLFCFLASIPVLGVAPKLEISDQMPEMISEAEKSNKISWFKKLSRAKTAALNEYKPIIIFFSRSECPWSRKLKESVFTDSAVIKALKDFIAVHVSLDDDSEDFNTYGITHVPTLLFMSSDGTVTNRISGYVDAKRLAALINGLTTANSNEKENTVDVLLKQLQENKMKDQDWEKLLRALGWPLTYRRKLQEAVFQLKKFPSKTLIKFLTHKKLSVRLGAIELLEEYQGENFGYDPWFEGSPTVKDLEAIAKWKQLAAKGKIRKNNLAVMSRERYDILLNKVLSSKRRIANRARFILKNGGNAALTAVTEFVARHPELTPGQKNRMKELEYAIIFTRIEISKALTLAHQLVYGNLDNRIKSLNYLGKIGHSTLYVIKDFLNDSESLIRETAVDAMVANGNRKCVEYLEKHLRKEKNNDVIFCILKNLGKIKSSKSGEVLVKYLKNSNEDLVIIALNSLTEIKAKKFSKKIIAYLDDSRWRVQVAALEAVSKLDLDCGEEISELLGSEDEFVRIKAIDAISRQRKYNSREKLIEVFFKYDSLKAPVIAAFKRMEKPIPDTFFRELKNKDVNILSPIAAAFEVENDSDLRLAEFLVDNKDDDIACLAVAAVAKGYECSFKNRCGFMMKVLNSGDRRRILTLLENFQVTGKEINPLREELRLKKDFEADKDESDNSVDDIMDAFSEKPKSKPGKKVEVDDLLDSFGAGDDTTQDKTKRPEVKVADFLKKLEDILASAKEERIKLYSAITLLKLGDTVGINYLLKEYPRQVVEVRQKLIESLRTTFQDTPEINKLVKLALNDKNNRIVTEVVRYLAQKNDEKSFLTMMTFLEKSSRYKVYDFFNYNFIQILTSQPAQKWAQQALTKKQIDPTMKVMAISIIGLSNSLKNRRLLKKVLNDKNIWAKRTATYFYGIWHFKTYYPELIKLTGNKVENLRLLLPEIGDAVLKRTPSEHVIYFDKKHSVTLDQGLYIQNSQKFLPEKYLKALRKLTQDISPRVRLKSYLVLMKTGEMVSPTELLKTVKKIPDRAAVERAISEYFAENYIYMDKKYGILLPYVKEDEIYSSKYTKIISHFAEGGAARTKNFKFKKCKIVSRSASADKKHKIKRPQSASVAKSAKLVLVFFYKSGCSDCKKIEERLSIIQKSYPQLEVLRKNISTVSAMRINEAYCDKFAVPSKYRLVAPALFTESGYLIKSSAGFEKIGNLIVDSMPVKNQEWYVVNTKEMERSEERITERYEKIKLATIFLAGLFDGINPCAFATIIFFISYMLIARKEKREIMQVSAAFISGVFIAYFLMGIGVTEFITRFKLVQTLGKWFNYLIMASAFIMMILSLIDAVICLRGNPKDIKLQLPAFLKERIRSSVRQGAKMSNFIIAAFFAGIVISFLELACTGQVYAPTILFMLKTTGKSLQAYFLLVVYNLAFILPLIFIFGLSYFGMSSMRLTSIFQKHMVWVKFGTALVFLAIFILALMTS